MSSKRKKEDIVEKNKEEKKSTHMRKGKEYPFWWNEKTETLSKALRVKSREKDKSGAYQQGSIAWTKRYEAKENWNTRIRFGEGNVRTRIKKEVIHGPARSEEELEEDEMWCSRKILLKPTKEQKLLIQRWMRITRFTYNTTLRWIKQKKCPCNFEKARYLLLSEERNEEASRYPWLFDNKLCPRQAKDEALFEMISSVHSSKRSLEEKKIKKTPKMEKRSERDHQRVERKERDLV